MAGDGQGRSFSISNGRPGEGCGEEGSARRSHQGGHRDAKWL